MKFSLTAALVLWGVQEKEFKLEFDPKEGAIHVVRFSEDQTWEDPEEDMKGTLRTELTLRWTFATEDGKRVAKAAFDRVVYRGEGRRMGTDFKYDIEWTAKDGYLKGKDSDADKRWVAQEIGEGVKLRIDNRAACETGEC